MCLFHSPLVSYGIEGKQQRTWRLWSAVYFLWVCPAHKNFEWFVDVLKEVERHNQDGILEIHIFVTQMFNKLIFEQLYCKVGTQKLPGSACSAAGRPKSTNEFDAHALRQIGTSGRARALHVASVNLLGPFICIKMPKHYDAVLRLPSEQH
ncbi:hypothetical protein niasHT_010113 [Heterodera trifolii]|uniref:Ferric reductase NAD binding domain-containing protein n=1 Tax=Heterodera trifolii TaxID=157864 RepID=A0ABD2LW99_9BILA